MLDFLTTHDALSLRPVARETRALVADHPWHDGALVSGPLASWRASFPRATVVNLSGRTSLAGVGVCGGLKKVYLCGVRAPLDRDALVLLRAATEVVVQGDKVISQLDVEVLIRSGCDVRVTRPKVNPSRYYSGILNELSAIAAALELCAPRGGGDAEAVAAAARVVLAARVALPTVFAVEETFRNTSSGAAITALLRDATAPPVVLVAACRAALVQVSHRADSFVATGGIIALARLLSHPEPSVVIAACGALRGLNPHNYPNVALFTHAMADESRPGGGGGGGGAQLCRILRGLLGCVVDDVLIAASRTIPTFGDGFAAFNAAGGMGLLVQLIPAAAASANCSVLEGVCDVIALCIIGAHSAAVSFVTSGGVELLAGLLSGGGTAGRLSLSATRAVAVCSALASVQRCDDSDPVIAGASGRFLAVAGGHAALAALMDVRGAAGLSPRLVSMVRDASSVVCWTTASSHGKAGFAEVGGKERVAQALAWFSGGAVPLRRSMPNLVTLGKRYGVVSSAADGDGKEEVAEGDEDEDFYGDADGDEDEDDDDEGGGGMEAGGDDFDEEGDDLSDDT